MAASGPVATHHVAKSMVKGEDFLFVEPRTAYPDFAARDDPPQKLTLVRRSLDSAQENELDSPPRDGSHDLPLSRPSLDVPTYGLYCVFDGHNGPGAATHACQGLAQAVHERMPGPPPPESDIKRHRLWRERLQHALVGALAYLHESFACNGEPAGCTATVVLQCGWYITVANLGDSRALVDTGACTTQLTVDHRVASHAGERRRLESNKVLIAPIDISGEGPASGPNAVGYGPLRMWPGGLCLSRSLGDFDVGASVLCAPHIHQVKLPSTGARLMIASDGVWDAFDSMTRVGVMSRHWTTQAAPNRLVQAIRRAYGGLRDDTTVIVADFLPPDGGTFPEVCSRRKLTNGSSTSSTMACLCMARPAAKDDDDDEAPRLAKVQPLGKLEVLLDIDIAALAGLIPDSKVDVPPSWYSDVVGEDLREIQVAAVEAWTQLRKVRTASGKVPSRDDLAGYFARAHRAAAKPQPAPTRTPHPLEYTVKFGATPSELGAPVHKVHVHQQPDHLPPASTRFKGSTSSMASYGKRFGHYANRKSADEVESPDTPRTSTSSSRSQPSPGSPPPVEEKPEEELGAKDSEGVPEGAQRHSMQSMRSRQFSMDGSEDRLPMGDAREHRVKLGRNVLMQEQA